MTFLSKSKLRTHLKRFPEDIISNIIKYIESDICKICDLISMTTLCSDPYCSVRTCIFCVHDYIKCKYCFESFCGIICYQRHDCAQHYLEIVESGSDSDSIKSV